MKKDSSSKGHTSNHKGGEDSFFDGDPFFNDSDDF
jgi:hypothetical protein